MNRESQAATDAGKTVPFLVEAFRNPRSVGAVAPSGRALASALTREIRCAAPGPMTVLEVGAGTGPATREILAALPRASRFDIVETSPAFTSRLRQITRFHESSSVEIHQGQIQEYVTDRQYDAVVSGLPMTNFEPPQVDAIMTRMLDLLRPGGTLTYFAYLGTRIARRMFATPAEARRHAAVDEIMKTYQRKYAVRQRRIWLNLPPAWVWTLAKPGIRQPGNSCAHPTVDTGA